MRYHPLFVVDLMPAHGLIKLSGNRQQAIAHHFRLHSRSRKSPIQLIVWIEGTSRCELPRGACGRVGQHTGAAIGLTCHDQAMHVLHGPVRVHQLACQPVQEFGVRRTTAVATKVVSRLNQRLSKVSQPDVIYGDACGQGIVSAGDPVRQRSPPA